MTLASGSRVGPYEIGAKLGEGGMGEVWRATDSRLRREVAIKTLPAAFTADPERLARFEREAQTLAALNHPNVAAIYGLEEANGARALVMELVEGEDLGARIARGALPLDEALAIARQIAEALEAAHEQGIVHRDLKPANVKVRADGTVKVLDFGLAKAMETGVGPPSGAMLANSPTLARSPTLTAAHGTQLGVILGTAAYMSPEQARGGAVDKRADIWAFGVVLFEMLTGRPLFAGETVSDTLAGVLKSDVDFASLPAAVPLPMRRLLRQCLERNPKNRLHDVADARLVLAAVAAGDADAPPLAVAAPSSEATSRPRAARALPGIAGLALGALAVALADRTVLAPPPPEPPSLVPLTYSGKDSWPVASPDGKTLAFVSTRDGTSRIWLKQLATGEEVAITSGPADGFPSFSPDGASLLFLRGTTPPLGLYTVSTVGGEPRRISEGLAGSAAWSPDGRRIALTRAATAGGLPDTIVTVAADGGDERQLVRLTDVTLFGLRWSPDGRAIGAATQLRTNFAAQQSILEVDAASGARRTLYEPPAGALITGWAWSGADAVVFSEASSQSGSAASRLRRIGRRGGPVTTLLSLRQPSAWLDVAGAGQIVTDQATPTQNLGEWVLGGEGTAPAAAAAPLTWWTRGASVDRQPVFSPDGKRLVFNSDRGGHLDVWELELERGALRRLTVDAADDWDPAFTPDGRHLLWSSNRSGNFEIWSAASDGSGVRKVTADGVDAENPTATADGEWIVYASANPAASGVWKIHPDGSGAVRLVAGALGVPELSPDGRWVSFVDLDESRLRVVTLADGAEVFAVDLSLAFVPLLQPGRSRWLPGTSELVWLEYEQEAGSWRLVAQQVAPGRDTRGTRRALLEGSPDAVPESFAISHDGTRLVVSVNQTRSELLLVSGLPGVTR